MTDYTEYYEFALKLAAEAGDLIRAGKLQGRLCRHQFKIIASNNRQLLKINYIGYNDDSKKVDFKLDVDLVTETDKKTEQYLMNAIKAKYPSHLFIGEEV